MERKYKDSGIEWIGKIPESWEVCRFKNLHEKANVGESIDKEFCTDNSSDILFYTAGLKPIYTSYNDFPDWKYVDANDLLLARNGTPYVYLPLVGAVYSDHIIRTPIKKNVDKAYIRYCLQQAIASVVVDTVSIATWSVSVWDKQLLPYPPFHIQQRIADYLDEKCGEIDSLIALQEQTIEKLKAYKQSVITEAVTKGLDPNAKLVPSGIDWIKEIPEGWKVLPVKRMCQNITDGSHFSPNTAGEGKAYITVSNVYNDEVHVDEAAKISIDDFSVLVANGCQPPIGSVLLAKDGTVGRTAVVQDNDYVVLSSLGILTPLGTVLSKYLKYLLDSDPLQAQMQLAMAGSALRRITITKICKLIGIQPPLSEQKAIITHLDDKCSDIDHLIALKQQKIESLKDYKKSVIYEAVTGKTTIE